MTRRRHGKNGKRGRVPTNALSVLRMLHPDPQTNGANVIWQSVSGHSYTLERATDGTTNFEVLGSHIAGQEGFTPFMDSSAANGDWFF